jgi:hypothetical protein
MLAGLIAGQRDPHALADLARKQMRAKISVLQETLTVAAACNSAPTLSIAPDAPGTLETISSLQVSAVAVDAHLKWLFREFCGR